jgi:hypothetical protein
MLQIFYYIGGVITITIIYMSYYVLSHESSNILKVLQVISGFSIVILTSNIFLNSFVANRDIYQKNAKNTLEIVNRNFSNIYKLFNDTLPYTYDLYVETHPDIKFKKQSITNYQSLDTNIVFAKEINMCFFLIQSMEDFLTIGKYDETGPEVWISIFMRWLHSNKLILFWKDMKGTYSKDTQDFVDSMISNVEILKNQRNENKKIDYKELIKTVKFQFRS